MNGKRQPIKLIKKNEMVKYFKMPEAIDCMSYAFACLSSGKYYVPKITIISNESLTFLMKPSFIDNHDR
jgi:hypothetical protein